MGYDVTRGWSLWIPEESVAAVAAVGSEQLRSYYEGFATPDGAPILDDDPEVIIATALEELSGEGGSTTFHREELNGVPGRAAHAHTWGRDGESFEDLVRAWAALGVVGTVDCEGEMENDFYRIRLADGGIAVYPGIVTYPDDPESVPAITAHKEN
jgi:hypothetical protein